MVQEDCLIISLVKRMNGLISQTYLRSWLRVLAISVNSREQVVKDLLLVSSLQLTYSRSLKIQVAKTLNQDCVIGSVVWFVVRCILEGYDSFSREHTLTNHSIRCTFLAPCLTRAY
jgi:hypothetical protein